MRFRFLTDNDTSFKAVWAWAKQLVTDLNKMEAASISATPTGGLMLWPTETPPVGWLICDGGGYTAESQPALFAVLGYRYGGAAGLFNLPDYRNKSLMGAGSVVALGLSAGALDATLTVDNLPAHGHEVTDPGHLHALTDLGHTHALTMAAHNHTVTINPHNHAVTDAGHVHTITDPGHFHTSGATPPGAGGGGLGAAVDVVGNQNTGTSTTGITVNSATTGVTIQNTTATGTIGNTVATGTNALNVTGIVMASADTGITIGDTGGGQAFSILSPVMGVNVIIKA